MKTGPICFILMNIWSVSSFLKLLHSCFGFCEWSKSTIHRSGCLKCISDMKVSPPNRKLLIILFIVIHFKISPSNSIFIKVVVIPHWLKILLVSCSLINIFFFRNYFPNNSFWDWEVFTLCILFALQIIW